MNKLTIPSAAAYVIEKLNKNNFEAFLVGGCVRDRILGRDPSDWDVTTNATPEEVKNFFERTYNTGIRHGTISVLIDQTMIEVTTYRIDGKYSDHRRPDRVSFTTSLKSDLERRDFTVNALAYHPDTGLVDYFDGLKDIEERRIKAVGDADLRFREDALRMLRAVRFGAQLGFDIDADTFDAIGKNAGLITNISAERIRDELNKILISPRPMYFDFLHRTGLLEFIIPEFTACYHTTQNNPYHVYTVAEHILHTMDSISGSSILRWTMLLHDIGKPPQKTTDEKGIDHFYGHQQVSADMAQIILGRLRFDINSIKQIKNLIIHHDIELNDTQKAVRRAANKVGEDAFPDLLEVQRADAMGQNRIYLDKRLIKLNHIKNIFFEIKKANQCLNTKDMAVNGHDLIGLGMKPGIEIKNMLNYLFEYVLEDPALNEKQTLLKLAEEKWN